MFRKKKLYCLKYILDNIIMTLVLKRKKMLLLYKPKQFNIILSNHKLHA